MQITIKLFATLREGRFDEQMREVPEGTTVGDVRRLLKINEELPTLNFMNGRSVDVDRRLEDGDVLAFFPPIGGG